MYPCFDIHDMKSVQEEVFKSAEVKYKLVRTVVTNVWFAIAITKYYARYISTVLVEPLLAFGTEDHRLHTIFWQAAVTIDLDFLSVMRMFSVDHLPHIPVAFWSIPIAELGSICNGKKTTICSSLLFLGVLN